MPGRRVRLLAAAIATVASMAATAPAALAHPEGCSTATVFSAGWLERGPFDDDSLNGSEICFSQAAIDGFDDSAAALAPGDVDGSDNLELLANLPKTVPFEKEGDFNSDLAFWGRWAFQGNYDGIQITDVKNPANPRVVAKLPCPGSQNDVSVWKGLLFTSTDSSRNKPECAGNLPQPATNPASWEGVRIFDVSNPAAPRYLSAVETDCGSHTHTILPERDRVLIYVSSYSPNATFPDCQPPHDKISVIEVPLDDPTSAAVINEPVLFPDGGSPGVPGATSPTSGCHDITVYQAIDLAAGACMGEGVLMDISNPVKPKVIGETITDPNFAFWHSATISHDGTKVLFTDELGGGGAPTCNPTIGPTRGADAIYDITRRDNPRFLSYFKIPRTQTNTENCVAHNGNLVPRTDRDIFVQAWYQGGISVIDWTDGANPRELAWFDRGPVSTQVNPIVLGGSWSTYFYRDHLFSNDIQKGFDALELSGPEGRGTDTPRYLNAQTQEPVR